MCDNNPCFNLCFMALLSCLNLVENHALLRGSLTHADVIEVFSRICANLVAVWRDAEKARKEKELEHESLYK